MTRRLVAAVWLLGAIVPLLLAMVFLFGCCVLPFHQVVHKLMPICDVAADVMRAESGDEGAAQPVPARQKEQPVKRLVAPVTAAFRLVQAAPARRTLAPAAATAYRSYITLGAIRCDRDVGLHVFVETFLI